MKLNFVRSGMASAAFIASLTALACKGLEPMPHTFVVAVDRSSIAATVPPLVTTTPDAVGQVVFKGAVSTSTYGYRLSGRVRSISADSITLVVLAHRPSDSIAPDAYMRYHYTAKVGDLPSGVYTVRILHAVKYLDYYSETVALDTTVTIP